MASPKITYRVDSGSEQTYTAPFVLSDDGTHTLTVQSTDNAGVYEVPKTFTIQIASLKITSTSPLAGGRVDIPYSATLAATGGTPPYAWTVVPANSLPAGLTLDAATGAISGTPTTAGTTAFTAQVIDARGTAVTKEFVITVAAGNKAPTANPGGPYGVVAGQVITLTGSGSDPDTGDTLTYDWDLDDNGSFETPGQVVTFSAAGRAGPDTQGVVLRVCDQLNACGTARAVVTIYSQLNIVTPSPLKSGTVGEPYSVTLQASGGTLPYTWAIDSGQLPPGLSLNAATGVISGTPTEAGTYGFTIRVTDSSQITTTKRFTLEPPLVPGNLGEPYPPRPLPVPVPGPTPPPCTNYTLAPGSDPLPPGMMLDPNAGVLSGTPTTGGRYQLIVQCTYNTNQTATADYTITINNPKPTLSSLNPNAVTEGSPSITVTIMGTGFVGTSKVRWNSAERPTTFVSSTQLQAVIPSTDLAAAGTANVAVFNPTPGGGESNVLTFTVKAANRPPVANAGPDQMVKEGATVTLDGSGSTDPDNDTLTYAWTVVSCTVPGIAPAPTSTVKPTFAALDNGTCTFRLTISDGKPGGTATDEVTVTITNVAPSVGTVTGPLDPVKVGTAVTIGAPFTDPGVRDTHTATVSWGDGTTPPGTVSETNGSGSVSGGHTYTTPGVYTVEVVVKDKDGDTDTSSLRYVVVYDPDGSFITGGGWINSPTGACKLTAACEGATGKATFGFVSKYKPGATVPTGQTQFEFKAGNLNFHSTAYDWLVVSGSRAQFKGTGTINGSGSYGFLLTAIDGQPDRFRIKIWDKATGNTVYDNQMGLADDADPTTALGGGSIQIHK